MRALPPNVEEKIVARLYRDAEQLGWLSLSNPSRTAQYAKWLVTPEVGGILSEYMALESARVWIKDGPMKEFSRAVAGHGKYAGLVSARVPSADDVVDKTLGAGWRIRPGTVKIKPLRCIVDSSDGQRLVVWGLSKDFKHLLWGALQEVTSQAEVATVGVVVVIDTLANPTQAFEMRKQAEIAERCGMTLERLSIR